MTTTDEIIKYVMESPSNTNPAVLRSLLNEHGGAGAGGGNLVLRQTSSEPYTPEFPREADEGKTFTRTEYNHTWQEVYDAVAAGAVVLLSPPENKHYLEQGYTLIVDMSVREYPVGVFTVHLQDADTESYSLMADSKDQYLSMVVMDSE